MRRSIGGSEQAQRERLLAIGKQDYAGDGGELINQALIILGWSTLYSALLTIRAGGKRKCSSDMPTVCKRLDKTYGTQY